MIRKLQRYYECATWLCCTRASAQARKCAHVCADDLQSWRSVTLPLMVPSKPRPLHIASLIPRDDVRVRVPETFVISDEDMTTRVDGRFFILRALYLKELGFCAGHWREF